MKKLKSLTPSEEAMVSSILQSVYDVMEWDENLGWYTEGGNFTLAKAAILGDI
jgi:hypothetical protein